LAADDVDDIVDMAMFTG